MDADDIADDRGEVPGGSPAGGTPPDRAAAFGARLPGGDGAGAGAGDGAGRPAGDRSEHRTTAAGPGAGHAGSGAGHAGPVSGPAGGDLARLVEQAVIRHLTATPSGLRRQRHPEARWPASASVVVAIVLQLLLPRQLALLPGYLLPALEGALLVGLTFANPVRIVRRSAPIRSASVALIVLITLANAISAVLLIRAIAENQLPVGPAHAAIDLLSSGALIWGTNVIAFALWYWEFDRGGPVRRLEHASPYPDLLFPQMTVPGLTPSGWGPRFVDYLYLSYTNATAFSPTDVMPLAGWAKLTMLAQSTVSLAVGALVIARAVNII